MHVAVSHPLLQHFEKFEPTQRLHIEAATGPYLWLERSDQDLVPGQNISIMMTQNKVGNLSDI